MKHFSIENLSPLYEAVQSSNLFADSKLFVDCTPKSSPEDILFLYEKIKNQSDFDLKTFVESYFTLPTEPHLDYKSDKKPIKEHIESLWNVLTRLPDEANGTLIPLPNPYIVPGGRFREIYYWDSYFTMLGLRVSGRVDVIENMVNNFAHLIENVGFIPNGNRTYYLGRSQPPFFALMVELLSDIKGKNVLLTYQKALEKEYAFWIEGESSLSAAKPAHRRVVRLSENAVLNRYWDDQDTPRPEAFVEDVHVAKKTKATPSVIYRNIRAAAESGWDFSSRWFRDSENMATIQTTDLIPVDLNCLLLKLEQMLMKSYDFAGNTAQKALFKAKIKQRSLAIQSYFWSDLHGFYFDYHHLERRNTEGVTLAAIYPLFFKVSTKIQAAKVAKVIENNFVQLGGVTTTLNRTGQQWDAPNGWAPLQWLTYKGLKNYGFTDLANKIKVNWLKNVEKVYDQTGKMMEKYNVMDINLPAGGGEYPNQDGFGWTNGVYLMMKYE